MHACMRVCLRACERVRVHNVYRISWQLKFLSNSQHFLRLPLREAEADMATMASDVYLAAKLYLL